MAFKLTAEKMAKTANNKIGKFDVQYNFEHAEGEAPEVAKARGTIDGSLTILDAMYFPATGNFSATFHNLADDVDVTVIAGVLKDLKSCK